MTAGLSGALTGVPAGTVPHRITFDAAAVNELRSRIDLTRWPRRFGDEGWLFGTDQDYLRELVDYWHRGFDFVAAEHRINALPNFLTDLDDLPIHHIHVRSGTPEARAVLLLHGWPGSVVEFLDVIPQLSRPSGQGEEPFHVVAASLQGFGDSPGAAEPGLSPVRIADRLVRLMRKLGYERFIVQGGDWGSLVASHIASIHPERVLGLHVTLAHPIPPAGLDEDPLALVQPHERQWLKANAFHATDGRGYFEIQKTRPETLAIALSDSPVGWCAWVLDTFHRWTDCVRDGVADIRHAVTWDQFLTNLSLYWFTDTISSSMRFYREQFLVESSGAGMPGSIDVPTGVGVFPREIIKSPRAWMERRVPLVHWTEHPRGGHFGALEQPELFTRDLRAFAGHLDG